MKWFSHDAGALNDVKLYELRVKYKSEGGDPYAVFFQLLELQAIEEKPIKLTEATAQQLLLPISRVKEFVRDFVRLGLFDREPWKKGYIFSSKLESRADNYSRRKKREADDKKVEHGGSKIAEWCQKIEAAWHETTLPRVANWSSMRKEKLDARLKNPYFEENCLDAIAKMGASEFCNGKKGWRATIDFLLANDNNIVKVMEGRYDDRETDPLLKKYGVHDENR